MPMPPEKAVLTAGLVTIGSTVIFNVTPEKLGGKGSLPTPRLLIGTGVTFFGLSILADIAPGIASPLAAAIAVTAVTYYGFPILSNYMTDSNVTEKKINTSQVAGPPAPRKV